MIGRYRRELSVAAAYAGLLLVLALAAPRFYGPDQMRAFVVSNAAAELIVPSGPAGDRP